jgi:raffinose/stachyose/melibiose transport system substrate-binding protein
MNFDRVIKTFGIALLAICFAASILKVVKYRFREELTGKRILRFAHTHLEPGVREAFDSLAADYMATHPDVAIEQITVPERIYKVWVETKLFGGNVPDIVRLHSSVNNDHLLSYFLPLEHYIEEPNPYNRNSPLEDTRWRDTFFDGLNNNPSYNVNLLNTFGVPNTIFTNRVYYNKRLLKQIAGSVDEPKDFQEFLNLCDTVIRYRSKVGISLYPMAGSRENSTAILDRLFGSQTQKMAPRLEPTNELQTLAQDSTVAYLAGKWSLRSPEIINAFKLMRRVGNFFTPGFLQLKRDDAIFQFTQEKALMIASGSYDAQSIRVQSPFEVGVFSVPMPLPDDPEYGPFVLGFQSEAALGGQAAFAIYKFSENRDLAVDFLHYITSVKGNTKFSKISGWLPSIIGIEPDEDIRPFMPFLGGYRKGINFYYIGAEPGDLVNANFHLLLGPDGSVEAFLDEVEPKMRDAMVTTSIRGADDVLSDAAYFDSMIGALYRRNTAGDGEWTDRISEMLESQTYQEEVSFYRRHEIALYGQN